MKKLKSNTHSLLKKNKRVKKKKYCANYHTAERKEGRMVNLDPDWNSKKIIIQKAFTCGKTRIPPKEVEENFNEFAPQKLMELQHTIMQMKKYLLREEFKKVNRQPFKPSEIKVRKWMLANYSLQYWTIYNTLERMSEEV